MEAVTFEKIKEAVARDNLSQELMEAMVTVPYDLEFQGALQPFQNNRHSLHVVDGVPMYGQRVIVPAPLRQAVLEGIHSVHQSIGKVHDRALHCVYWPGLYRDLDVESQYSAKFWSPKIRLNELILNGSSRFQNVERILDYY